MFEDQESDAINDASTDLPGATRGPGDTVTEGPAVSTSGPASIYATGGETVNTAAVPSETDIAVDEWFAKHFHGLGARLDEFLINHLRAATEDLKAILARAHP